MASVSSLDQDMRKLRLDRYTPGAANEVRSWIENTIDERLAPGDLMEALHDGVALCKLVNLAVSPGVKYKTSNMPFVQMENISHFLRACEMPPLSLPSHDRFLTVDLFDQKDPAQVLQCIAAFSRRANAVNPSAFPDTIGAKSKGAPLSPESTGIRQSQSSYSPRASGYTSNSPAINSSPATTFNSLNRSSYAATGTSPTKSNSLARGGLATGGAVSSWSKKEDESKTAPAWNIHQYGYLGGASQGNQGIAFGARRQITSTAPEVPSLQEKEKRLREKMEQEQRAIAEREAQIEAERVRAQEAAEAEKAESRAAEDRSWQQHTARLKEQERISEQQRESARSSQISQHESKIQLEGVDMLSPKPVQSEEAQRIADLERQLEDMKAAAAEREKELAQNARQQQEEQQQSQQLQDDAHPATASASTAAAHEDDWASSERDYLRKAQRDYQDVAASKPARPLPNPATYQSSSRTSRFLSSNPAPAPVQATQHTPSEAAHGTTAEVDAENARRQESQRATKAGGWASKSLLEREMERERERQREWEENQKEVASAPRDPTAGSGPGQSWSNFHYGYMKGDSQNRGSQGIGAGRRQIIGPRPPP